MVKIKIIATIFLLSLLSNPVLSQDVDKFEKIRDDIRIQEGILEQLLEASRDRFIHSRKIKGFYFEDYGLLFTVDIDGGSIYLEALRENLKALQEYGVALKENLKTLQEYELTKKEYQKTKNADKRGSGAKREAEATIVVSPGDLGNAYSFTFSRRMDKKELEAWYQKLDRKITTFLSSYVDIPNNLKGRDQIAMVVFLNEGLGDGAVVRMYQVPKKAIIDVRRGKLTLNDFEKKILKKQITQEGQKEEFRIMETILETALFKPQRKELSLSKKVKGIYLQDLGVMFRFGDLGNFFMLPESGELEKEINAKLAEKFMLKQYVEDRTKRSAEIKKKINKFENRVLEVLSTYAVPSLKSLPEDEDVFVTFGIRSYLTSEFSDVLIRVRKSDLKLYSEKRISLENLRKKAQIVHYK